MYTHTFIYRRKKKTKQNLHEKNEEDVIFDVLKNKI